MAVQQHNIESIHFTKGKHRFEILQTDSHGGPRYEGYFDGRLSVSAREKHVAARMLLRRHIFRNAPTRQPTLHL